jgi:4-cresol dehydrogenase (hydroxylating)
MHIIDELKKLFTLEDKVLLIDNKEATEHYGKTTFSAPVQIDCVIVINKEITIGKVLKLANALQFNLYPVGTNKNWGYGSFNVCSGRPNVILDLGQLCKITGTDKELGLVTLGPGVTQQQLYDFLIENNWEYLVPVTGAGPEAGIVSNALERGYGITPYNDHFYACTALKAFIPHPELCEHQYESALSAFDQSDTDFIDKSYKWGLGPYIDGLFTQSNLGIVSEMTIRLAPKPEYFSAFYLRVFKEEQFEQTVALVKDILKNYAGIVGSINLMDRRRLISITTENPNGFDSNVLMSEQQIQDIASKNQLPYWLVVGSIYGDKEVVKATKKVFKRKAKAIGSVLFSDSKRIKAATYFFKRLPKVTFVKKITAQLSSLQEGIEIMQGIPNQVALPLPYWRNPRIRPDKNKDLSPSKDNCGLLWYAPLIKMTASSLNNFVRFVRETTPKYGIEPLITFTNLKHDCVDSTVPIVFDLHQPEQIKNAHDCLNELIQKGAIYGFVPYRLDVNQQKNLDEKHMFWQTNNLIKDAFDPNRILSPGRYNPVAKKNLINSGN